MGTLTKLSLLTPLLISCLCPIVANGQENHKPEDYKKSNLEETTKKENLQKEVPSEGGNYIVLTQESKPVKWVKKGLVSEANTDLAFQSPWIQNGKMIHFVSVTEPSIEKVRILVINQEGKAVANSISRLPLETKTQPKNKPKNKPKTSNLKPLRVSLPLSLYINETGAYKVKTTFVAPGGKETFWWSQFSIPPQTYDPNKRKNIQRSEYQACKIEETKEKDKKVTETILEFCDLIQNEELMQGWEKQAFYNFLETLTPEDAGEIITETLSHWPIPEDVQPIGLLAQKTGSLMRPSDIEILERLLNTEPSTEASKLWGISILLNSTNKENTQNLKSILLNSKDWMKFEDSLGTSPPRAAAEALAKIGTEESLKPLVELAKVPVNQNDIGEDDQPLSPRELQLVAAKDSLNTINSAEAIKYLESIVVDKNHNYDWEDKLIAVEAIKNYWDDRKNKQP
jgi:hypothetical protein